LAGGRHRWRTIIGKTLRNIIVFAIIVAALYLLLPRLVDTEETIKLLGGAEYALLVVAVLLEICALLGYANLTRFVLRVLDIRMKLYEVLSVTVGSLAVSHLLSAGGVGGWVVTYNALRRRDVPHGLVFVAVAAQQFFNYIVLWILFAVALVYLIVARGQSVASYLAAVVLIGLLLWLTGYGIYLYNHRTKMRRRVAQAAHVVNSVTRRETIKEEHIDDWLDHLFAGMRRMTSHPGAFRRTFFYACGYWFFDLLCLYVTFLAFNYRIGVVYLVIGYIIAYAVGTLAPTPGGLGAVEGLMIALYVGFGVPSAIAVAVVLVYRLINFWLPIPPGLISYAAIR
jgi:glycosyltransferase 2 family protein